MTFPEFVLDEDFTRQVRAVVKPLPPDKFWVFEALREWARRNPPPRWDEDFKVKPFSYHWGAHLLLPPKSFGYWASSSI